jgi:hypothetical protein
VRCPLGQIKYISQIKRTHQIYIKIASKNWWRWKLEYKRLSLRGGWGNWDPVYRQIFWKVWF